jgi:hypothetical protein
MRGGLKAVLLISAIFVLVAVVLFVQTPSIRTGLSLALLAPIMWASAHLGLIDRIATGMGPRPYRRQYTQLRSQVDQMLREVRRLNWLAVDGQRGLRNSETLQRELDTVEERLKDLIASIRTSAGHGKPESPGQGSRSGPVRTSSKAPDRKEES